MASLGARGNTMASLGARGYTANRSFSEGGSQEGLAVLGNIAFGDDNLSNAVKIPLCRIDNLGLGLGLGS